MKKMQIVHIKTLQQLARREARSLRRRAKRLSGAARRDFQTADRMPNSEICRVRFEGKAKQQKARRLRQIANRLELPYRPKGMAGVGAPARW